MNPWHLISIRESVRRARHPRCRASESGRMFKTAGMETGMEESMTLTMAQIDLIRDSFHRLQPDVEAAYFHMASDMIALAD